MNPEVPCELPAVKFPARVCDYFSVLVSRCVTALPALGISIGLSLFEHLRRFLPKKLPTRELVMSSRIAVALLIVAVTGLGTVLLRTRREVSSLRRQILMDRMR